MQQKFRNLCVPVEEEAPFDEVDSPALELVLTDGDDISLLTGATFINDKAFTSKPRFALKTDVQMCRSESCQTCKPKQRPRFLKTGSVQAKDIRRLPPKWWIQGSQDDSILDALWSTMSYLLEFGDCSGKEDNIRDGKDDESKVDSDALNNYGQIPRRKIASYSPQRRKQ